MCMQAWTAGMGDRCCRGRHLARTRAQAANGRGLTGRPAVAQRVLAVASYPTHLLATLPIPTLPPRPGAPGTRQGQGDGAGTDGAGRATGARARDFPGAGRHGGTQQRLTWLSSAAPVIRRVLERSGDARSSSSAISGGV